MGTNFYCAKINKKEREKFIEKIDKLRDELISSLDKPSVSYKDILNDFLYDNREFEEEIHLGKRSCGWQFLWDYHDGKYFEPTLKSIKKFLSQKDIIIYDEYGEEFTVKQLFEDELKSCLYHDDKHIDGSEFGENRIPSWESHFFINDGLRFAKFEDFS